jgi:hypothetical protein
MIQGFTITNGYAAQGGGIYCTNASPVIINCVIAGNSTFAGTNGNEYPSTPGGNGGEGGGIYASDNSWPIISDCIISNNITGIGGYGEPCGNGGNGGGIACLSATIVGTLITGNAAGGANSRLGFGCDGNGGNGGGIFCSAAVVLDCVVQNNITGGGAPGTTSSTAVVVVVAKGVVSILRPIP